MDFLEQLKLRVMVSSGAMATEMAKRDFQVGGNSAVWALEHPDVFKEVIKDTVLANADIIGAGNASANRFHLRRVGLHERAYSINRDLVRLARDACPPHCYLYGSMMDLGHLLQPLGDLSFEEAYEAYREQVLSAAEGGVDIVWIMTMSDIRMMEAAIKAVKENTSIPVIASMAFNHTPKGARTIMGVSPEEAGKKLNQAGADVIGANCGGISPAQVTDVLKEMAEVTNKPLVAKPNAGKPEVIDGVTIHPMSPEDMAAHVPAWIEAGAKIVSGCCGAGPEHIARIAEAVRIS